VWWEDWARGDWAQRPEGSTPLGWLDARGNAEGVDATTLLFRRTFRLLPPGAGALVRASTLEMWSDNKSAWFWQGEAVMDNRQTYIGTVALFPRHVDAQGGTYTLAVQNSNDTMENVNPQGLAYRLCVTWAVPQREPQRLFLPLLLR
jgi:hypothetical protein